MPKVTPGEITQTEPIKNPDGSYTLPPVMGYTEIEMEPSISVYQGIGRLYIISPDIHEGRGYWNNRYPIRRHLYRCDPPYDGEFKKVREDILPPINSAQELYQQGAYRGSIINIGTQAVEVEKKDEYGRVLKDEFGNPIMVTEYRSRWIITTQDGASFYNYGQYRVYIVEDDLETGPIKEYLWGSAERLSEGLVLLGRSRIAYFCPDDTNINYLSTWPGAIPCKFKPMSFRSGDDETLYGIRPFIIAEKRYMKGELSGSGTVTDPQYGTFSYKRYSVSIEEVAFVDVEQGAMFETMFEGETVKYNYLNFPMGGFISSVKVPDDLIISTRTIQSGWVNSVERTLGYEEIHGPTESSAYFDGWITDITSFHGLSPYPENVPYFRLGGWTPTVLSVRWGLENGGMSTVVTFTSPEDDGYTWDTGQSIGLYTITYNAIDMPGNWSNPAQQWVYPDYSSTWDNWPWQMSNFPWPTVYVVSSYLRGSNDRFDVVSYNSGGVPTVTRGTAPVPDTCAEEAWVWAQNSVNAIGVLNTLTRNNYYSFFTGGYNGVFQEDTYTYNIYSQFRYLQFMVNAAVEMPVGGTTPLVTWCYPYFLTETQYTSGGIHRGTVFGEGIVLMGMFPDGKWFGLRHNENGVDYEWVYTTNSGSVWQIPSTWTPTVKETTCAQLSVSRYYYSDFRRCGTNSAIVRVGYNNWYYTANAGATWDGAMIPPSPNPTHAPEVPTALECRPHDFLAQIGGTRFLYAFHAATSPGLVTQNAYRYTNTDKDSPYYGRAYFKTQYPIDKNLGVVEVKWRTNFVDVEASEQQGHTVYIYQVVDPEDIEFYPDDCDTRIYIDNRTKRREDNTPIKDEPPPIAPWCKKITVKYWASNRLFGSCSDTYENNIPCAAYQVDFQPGSSNQGYVVALPEFWMFPSSLWAGSGEYIPTPGGQSYLENFAVIQFPYGMADVIPNQRGFRIEYYPPKVPEPLVAYREPNIVKAVAGTYTIFSVQAKNGKPPYTWTADSLPEGMSMFNGAVKGVAPQEEGDYPCSVTVQDSSEPKQSASVSVTLTVVPNSPGGE